MGRGVDPRAGHQRRHLRRPQLQAALQAALRLPPLDPPPLRPRRPPTDLDPGQSRRPGRHRRPHRRRRDPRGIRRRQRPGPPADPPRRPVRPFHHEIQIHHRRSPSACSGTSSGSPRTTRPGGFAGSRSAGSGTASSSSAGAIEYARSKGCNAVTCGHTHLPLEAEVDGVRYVNSGTWTEHPPARSSRSGAPSSASNGGPRPRTWPAGSPTRTPFRARPNSKGAPRRSTDPGDHAHEADRSIHGDVSVWAQTSGS